MISKITKYFKETRLELSKVAWPNKMELRDSTIVVIILSITMSLYIGIVDYILVKATTFIFR